MEFSSHSAPDGGGDPPASNAHEESAGAPDVGERSRHHGTLHVDTMQPTESATVHPIRKFHGADIIPRSLPSDPTALPSHTSSCNLSLASTPTTSFFMPFSPLNQAPAAASPYDDTAMSLPGPSVASVADLSHQLLQIDAGMSAHEAETHERKPSYLDSGYRSADRDVDGWEDDSDDSNDDDSDDDGPNLCDETTALGLEEHDDISNYSDNSLDRLSCIASTISDSPAVGTLEEQQVQRVLRSILAREFSIRLGISEPPPDAVDAVRECLHRISYSLQQVQAVGAFVPAGHHVPQSSGSVDADGSAPSDGAKDSYQGSSGGGMKRLAPRSGNGSGNGDGNESDRNGNAGNTGGGQVPGQGSGGNAGNRATKKAKVEELEEFPCPFRMRKPWRFNCREWETCAKARFKGIPDVKKHIRQHHVQQLFIHTCVRCDAGFTRLEEWQAHMRAEGPEICAVGPLSSLDDEMVSKSVAEKLRNRSEHYDWPKLWKTIYPGDRDVPEPVFHQIVELPEVEREYASRLPTFKSLLEVELDSLLSRSMLETMLSGWDTIQGRDTAGPRDFVFRRLEVLFTECVEAVFQGSREKASKTPPSRHSQSEAPVSGLVLRQMRGSSSSQSLLSAPRLSLTNTVSTRSVQSRSGHSSIGSSNLSSPLLSMRNSLGVSSHTSVQSDVLVSMSRPAQMPTQPSDTIFTTAEPVGRPEITNLEGPITGHASRDLDGGMQSRYPPVAEMHLGQVAASRGGRGILEESIERDSDHPFGEALGTHNSTSMLDVGMPGEPAGATDVDPSVFFNLFFDENAGGSDGSFL